MKVTLNTHDLVSMEYYCNASQSILSLLKDKGAPIDGTIYFSLKDGFVVRRIDDPANGSVTFHFHEKKRQPNDQRPK